MQDIFNIRAELESAGYIDVIRRLITMETVTCQGEFINMENASLDVVNNDTFPQAIPIYMNATGSKMLELTRAICNGVQVTEIKKLIQFLYRRVLFLPISDIEQEAVEFQQARLAGHFIFG